jgi:hypothetical protein
MPTRIRASIHGNGHRLPHAQHPLMPITTKGGKKVGVMEILNKKEGPSQQ